MRIPPSFRVFSTSLDWSPTVLVMSPTRAIAGNLFVP